MAKTKLTLYSDGYDAFKRRVIEDARALDRGEAPRLENSITFCSANEMVHVITPMRVALLEALTKRGSRSVTLLARELHRTRNAVLRDIHALEKLGIVETGLHPARGRSKVLVAKPTASRIELIYSIDSKINHRVAA
jgi:predicted transcriptional regulator